MLNLASDRAGIQRYTPHSFRHFVTSHLLDQGWPSVQVARFLGHANDSMVTRLYGNHAVAETMRLLGDAAAALTIGAPFHPTRSAGWTPAVGELGSTPQTPSSPTQPVERLAR